MKTSNSNDATLALEDRIIDLRNWLIGRAFPADEIPDNALEQAIARLDAANGKRRIAATGNRRQRTFDDIAIAEILIHAYDIQSTSWMHAGSVPASYNYPALTTVILGTVLDGTLYLGIASGPAKSTSPGRTWPALSPWRFNYRPETRLAQLRQWVVRCDPIPILST